MCALFSVDVFAYYDASPEAPAGQAELIRTWEASWTALGWTPRILTSRRARQSLLYRDVAERLGEDAVSVALPWLALHAAGGGWLVPKTAVNQSFRPARRRQKVMFYHPGILWSSKRGMEEILRAAWTPKWDKFFLERFHTVDLLGSAPRAN